MNGSWIIEAFGNERYQNALNVARQSVVYDALKKVSGQPPSPRPYLEELELALEVAELSAVEHLKTPFESWGKDEIFKERCREAFILARSLPVPDRPIEAAKFYLRMSCFAYLGDYGAHMRRILNERAELNLPIGSSDWSERVFATVAHAWLLLVRKRGWKDLNTIFEYISRLRKEQKHFEKDYLENGGTNPRGAAWELISLYHLAKAVELLATYIGQGRPNDIFQELDFHFERALGAARPTSLIELEMLLSWMHAGGLKMASDSIWMVTRSYNSRITKFVEEMTSPDNNQPMFEMLPPQRRSLLQEGLLDPTHRAVVVDMPTSSGKTLLAEFRILQALNYFREEGGWVAYLVPTRALVNQVSARLRKDLEPVGIRVEKVTPALDIDAIEESMLLEKGSSSPGEATERPFDVLVATPEKMDFMIRNGWETKIGRPLTLVVLDEAHNIAAPDRGIKIELLLATINRECKNAQFLLLTPYVPNSTELAQWLDPQNPKAISIGLSWTPNERVVGLAYPIEGHDKRHWSLAFRTLHTSHDTIEMPDTLRLGGVKPPLDMTYREVKLTSLNIAAAVTKELSKREDTVVVVANRIPWVWAIARILRKNLERKPSLDSRVELVQRFLRAEMGPDYELVDLLNYGVGVHHSGLSDEARLLMEWLVEERLIDVLVSTTAIAQGVNFPVSSVVLSDYRYPRGKKMPPQDFWNLAGRAGRLFQQTLGLVVFVSKEEQNKDIEDFVNKRVEDLVSTLIGMVDEVKGLGSQFGLEELVYDQRWSSFVRYLAHAYRQINDHQRFLSETEMILRGTLGYQVLTKKDHKKASIILDAVRKYAEKMKATPYVGLADTTGFSPETVGRIIMQMRDLNLSPQDWHVSRLFGGGSRTLRDLIGVMLSIPEIEESLKEIKFGTHSLSGSQLASLTIDWVSGVPLIEIAGRYFARTGSLTDALTDCSQAIFGKLTYAAPWGLSSLQNLPGSGLDFERMSEEDVRNIRNLPAMVYYGVNTEEAIAMRMLGVPRSAAPGLGESLRREVGTTTLGNARRWLESLPDGRWGECLPPGSPMSGGDCREIWKVLSGSR